MNKIYSRFHKKLKKQNRAEKKAKPIVLHKCIQPGCNFVAAKGQQCGSYCMSYLD